MRSGLAVLKGLPVLDYPPDFITTLCSKITKTLKMVNINTISIPLLGFVAYSGTGKTTLLEQLIPLLKAKGLRVGIIKHSHHGFDIDQPGKDSYRLHQAGADQTLIASRYRWALVVELGGHTEEVYLSQILPALNQDQLDLILIEGFKHEAYPKIELHRPHLGHALMFPTDDTIIAVATDAPLEMTTTLPVLDLNQPAEIVKFVEEKIIEPFNGKRSDL